MYTPTHHCPHFQSSDHFTKILTLMFLFIVETHIYRSCLTRLIILISGKFITEQVMDCKFHCKYAHVFAKLYFELGELCNDTAATAIMSYLVNAIFSGLFISRLPDKFI